MQRAYLTAICLLLVGALFPQNTEDLWCHELNNQGGLSSQDYNFYVYCDSEGLIWISSTKGLNQYNGHQVKNYHSDFRDSTALFGENIQSRFYEQSDQSIWFCTYEAVHRYDRRKDRFEHFFLQDENGQPIQEDYHVFHLEQDRFLWVRAGRNIYRVEVSDPSRRQRNFAASQPIFRTGYFHSFVGLDEDQRVRFVFSCSNEKIKGLERAEIAEGQLKNIETFFQEEQPALPELGVYQVSYENPEVVWISSNRGMVRWNMTGMKTDLFPFDFKGYSYFAPYSNRKFIVSFYQEGLFLFDRQSGQYEPYTLRSITRPDQQVSKAVRNIYLSQEGVLWITVPGEGLLYTHLRKKKFRSIPQPGVNQSGQQYLNFLPYTKDRVLLGYEKGVLIFDRSGHQQKVLTEPGLPSIMHLFQERSSGKPWMATYRGIFICDPEKGSFNRIPGTEGTVFLYLYQLENGDILASSLLNKIYRIRQVNAEWEVNCIYSSDKGGAGYTTIYEDDLGQVYICRNESGIEVFSYQHGELNLKRELEVRGVVYDYYEDANDSTLWIGTSFGLAQLNKHHLEAPIRTFTVRDGLPDNNVFSIIPAEAGSLWMSTNKGLVRFEKNEVYFRTFKLADGILSERFRPRSAQKMEDGSIWLGGMNGITIIPAGPIRLIQEPPRLFLSQLKIDDEIPDSLICQETGVSNLNQVKALEYTYRNNTISFYFAASDYADPLHTPLRYKLENEDEDFVPVESGSTGFARYSNLPSGNYRFIMQALNSDGVEEAMSERSLELRIRPPFWDTWWFKSASAVLLILTILAVMRYRLSQVREKEQLKTRIAENKMSALIAQMNPHFIFNSLQSVNRFILQKDRKQASEYLGRFSGLIRMMLEHSRTSKHLLEDEVKFLKLYMKVESQRFQIPFEYQVEVMPDVDQSIEIPSMMLQPFVENAIWHGVSHKAGIGHIRVQISQVEHTLFCWVEDDGVGRVKAAEIAMQKGKKHKSRAMEIVKERLDLLFPDQQEYCNIGYTDLVDAAGRPAGTRVEISLPLSD